MDDILSILEGFKGKEILIVGDVMLDTYMRGEVTRISAEAPIPVVKVESQDYFLGGAGNVAANVASLGGKATMFSFVGRDAAAEKVKELLETSNITYFLGEDSQTIQKIRILGGNQQLARADIETVKEKKFSTTHLKALEECAERADVIVLSDYAKGTITRELMNVLEPFKRKIIVDPKPKNKSLYRGVLLIKPNEKEAFDMTLITDMEEAGRSMKKEYETNILMTRGKKGMTLFTEREVHIPTYAKEVFDVTGAGDTTTAAIALVLAAGGSINDAAIIANHAAGIKVEKAGTYAVTLSELAEQFSKEDSKISDIHRLQRVVGDLKRKGKKIVWTNGCYDLLHVGHTRFLKEAKKLGDVLVVGINSDDSVRILKGPTRPIHTEKERAEILAGLEFVDHVFIFSETTVEKYLEMLKPAVYVKGGDFSVQHLENHVEGRTVRSYGGEIHVVPLFEGKSTTKIVQKFGENKHASPII